MEKKKEFFDAKEYNEFSEFKQFESFEYYKGLEFINKANETYKVNEAKSIDMKDNEKAIETAEEKSLDNKQKEKEVAKNKTKEESDKDTAASTSANATSQASEEVVKKILETSTTSITTAISGTVVAATAAVAVCSTILINDPKASISIIERGMDYVSYSIDVEELNEDAKYYLMLTGKDIDYKIDIPTIGTYSDIVSGLKPFRSYSLKLVGENGEIGGTTTYEEKTFYTLKGADPTAVISYDYFSSNSFSYQCYISDYDQVGVDYYVEVLKDGAEFYTNYTYEGGYLKDSFASLDDGEYTFNVYGTIYEEKQLVKTDTVSLPYGISGDHVENVEVSVDDKIVITGDFISRFKGNELSYSIDYYNDDALVNVVKKYITVDDKFRIEEDILNNATSFDFTLYRKTKVMYSYKNGVIYKVPNVTGNVTFDYEKLKVELNADNYFKLTPKYKITLINDSDETKVYEDDAVFTDNKFSLEINDKDYTYYIVELFYDNERIFYKEKTSIDYPRIDTISEVKGIDNMNITGKVISNATTGKIVYSLDGDSHEENITFTDGKFSIFVPIDNNSSYSYSIYVGDKLAYSKNNSQYAVDEFISYSKPKIADCEFSFNESNKLDISVPITFTSTSSYQVEVNLLDNAGNVIDTKVSKGNNVTFSNVDILSGYKLSYSDQRVIDSVVVELDNVTLSEEFSLPVPSVSISSITYDVTGAIITYSVSDASNISKFNIVVDKDGVKDTIEVDLSLNPTSVHYDLDNTVTSFEATPQIELVYEAIRGKLIKEYSKISSSPVLKMKLEDVKEVTSPSVYNISGSIINNRYAQGTLYLYGDNQTYTKTFDIVSNKFDVSVDVSNISSYSYKIVLGDEEVEVSNNTTYDSAFPISYTKTTIDNLTYEFASDTTMDITVLFSFTSVDGYRIKVNLLDADDNVIATKYSTSSDVKFEGIDFSDGFKIEYIEERIVDETIYKYGEDKGTEAFEIAVPSIVIGTLSCTDEAIVIPYTLTNDSYIKSLTLEVTKDGVKEDVVIDLSTYPTSYNLVIANTVTSVKIVPVIVGEYSNISGTITVKGSEVSYNPVLEMKLENVKEIKASDKYNIQGSIKNNRYTQGTIYFTTDKGDETETFTISDNKFSISFPISEISTYGYKIVVGSETLVDEASSQYEVTYNLTYTKPTFNDLTLSFETDGDLNIVVPISFIAKTGYKVLVYLIDDDEITVDYEYSEGSSVTFSNVDVNKSYKVGFQEFYYEGEDEYIFNDSLMEEVIYVDPSEVTLGENLRYGIDGKVYVDYSFLISEKAKSYSLVLTIAGEDSPITIDLTTYPTYYSFVPKTDDLTITPKLVLTYEGFNGTLNKEFDDVEYKVSRVKSATPSYSLSNNELVIPIISLNEYTFAYIDGDGGMHNVYLDYNGCLTFDSLVEGTNTYKIIAMDSSSKLVGLPLEVSFDYTSSIPEIGPYTFENPNCGDVDITYASDGTVSLEFDTNFSSTDSSIYGYVILTNNEVSYKYKVTDGDLIVPNLPYGHDDHLGLTYQTIKVVNGYEYILSETTVSGTIEFSGINVSNEEGAFNVDTHKVTYSCDVLDFYNTIESINVNLNATDKSNNFVTITEEMYTLTYEEGKVSLVINAPTDVVKITIIMNAEVDGYEKNIGYYECRAQIVPSIEMQEEYSVYTNNDIYLKATIVDYVNYGDYKAEFEIEYPSGTKITVQSDDIYKYSNYFYYYLTLPEGVTEFSVTPTIKYRFNEGDEYISKVGDKVSYSIIETKVGTPYYDVEEHALFIPLENYESSYSVFYRRNMSYSGNDLTSTLTDMNCVVISSVYSGDNSFFVYYQNSDGDIISLIKEVKFTYNSSIGEIESYAYEALDASMVDIHYSQVGEGINVKLTFALGFETESEDIYGYVVLNDNGNATRHKFTAGLGDFVIDNLTYGREDQIGLYYQIVKVVNGSEYLVEQSSSESFLEFDGVEVSNSIPNFDYENRKVEWEMTFSDYYSLVQGVNATFLAKDINQDEVTITDSMYTLTYENNKATLVLNIPEGVYEISVKLFADVDGSDRLIHSDEYRFYIDPEVVMNESYTLTSDGKVKVSFEIENALHYGTYEVSLNVYAGSETPTVISKDDILMDGYVGYAEISVPAGISEFKVIPKISWKFNEEDEWSNDSGEEKTYSGYYVNFGDILYNEDEGKVWIQVKEDSITSTTPLVMVKDGVNEEITSLNNGYISYSVSNGDSLSFETYLYDKTNNKKLTLPSSLSFSIDSSSLEKGSVYKSCPNPGGVSVTYNEDKSANILFKMEFDNSSSPNVSYVVYLSTYSGDEYLYRSEERNLTVSSISSSNSLIVKYYLCEKSNNVYYMYDETYPSGSIDFPGIYVISDTPTIADGILTSSIEFASIFGYTINSVDAYVVCQETESGMANYISPDSNGLSGNTFTLTAALPTTYYSYSYAFTIYYGDSGSNTNVYYKAE